MQDCKVLYSTCVNTFSADIAQQQQPCKRACTLLLPGLHELPLAGLYSF